MNKNILFKILQLDSLISCLEWTERVRIHLFINNKIESLTPKIKQVYEWILKENWEAPQIGYAQDRLQYFYEPHGENWHPVENYLNWFPELKDELNNLKLK